MAALPKDETIKMVREYVDHNKAVKEKEYSTTRERKVYHWSSSFNLLATGGLYEKATQNPLARESAWGFPWFFIKFFHPSFSCNPYLDFSSSTV
jgi:hypothetical protein